MNQKTRFSFFRKNDINYLDSAATTQVPDKVVSVVRDSLEYKGNPHRGSHITAHKNEEKIDLARANIARFINADDDELVFTNNTTDSINLAVDSISAQIEAGDEILISMAEHHSNMLPFQKLIKKGAILRVININEEGFIDLEDLKNKLSEKTKIVSVQHCSNVLGTINDLEAIGKVIKEYDEKIFFIVDAAQSIAHIPVDTKAMQCDFLGFSGHKMYGPDGIGVLFVSKKVFGKIEAVRMGGGVVNDTSIVQSSGSDTLVIDAKNSLLILEGGTPNVANIIGLSEAVSFIRSIGFEEIVRHERELLKFAVEKLGSIENIKIFGPGDINKKIGVLSFVIADFSIAELGDHLNKRKICIRYGSHCAFPLIDRLGTETLRISFGVYNDEDDIEKLVQELKFYIDKKQGKIVNPNLESIRNQVYYKNLLSFNKKSEIFKTIFSAIKNIEETEVVIMAGHFLAIPDRETNTFFPSIKPIVPERLQGLLDEFGMTTFPLFTWELGCALAEFLKKNKVKAQLMIAANDTTGINELKNSSVNTENKSAEAYREEFLSRFGISDIHPIYKDILKKYNLSKRDLLKFSKYFYTNESILRARFYKFVKSNKKYFDGMIDYNINKEGSMDLSIKVLDNQEIKTCKVNTFNSKMGGQFCVIEVVQMLAELFGVAQNVFFENMNKQVANPKLKKKDRIFVMLSPAMCNNAISSGAELYTKLFLQDKDLGSFKFFNIPFGPDSEQSLALGSECTYISNKDNLLNLKIENYPDFAELWKLNEYNLLYNTDEYVSEMESLFSKINISKDSRILDTCVGPGFFVKELIEKKYNIETMDKSEIYTEPFVRDLKTLGIEHSPRICEWMDIDKYFEKESFDLLLNRGNSIIFANGGLLEKIEIDREKTLDILRQTLKKYFDILKPGGYLYIDKYKDSEVPAEKIAAKLSIESTNQKKDLVFKVERRPDKKYRYASMILRAESEKDDESVYNQVYDLTETELEDALKSAGFEIERLNLKSERHFVVWLARKPK